MNAFYYTPQRNKLGDPYCIHVHSTGGKFFDRDGFQWPLQAYQKWASLFCRLRPPAPGQHTDGTDALQSGNACQNTLDGGCSPTNGCASIAHQK